MPPEIKALVFDVFGTVVDWRSSVAREAEALGDAKGFQLDWGAFGDDWRARYQPAMEQVRSGRRDWTTLDDLHRENLLALLDQYGIETLTEEEIDDLNRAWHRLDPWPDAVEGLTRLKSRYIIATLSNGNIALMVNLAKYGGLPWDAILGAELARNYKTLPAVYLRSVEALDLMPGECLMVSAHNNDLQGAAACGLRTAFIPRPTEHGPNQTTDLQPDTTYDFIADDLNDLARQLGT